MFEKLNAECPECKEQKAGSDEISSQGSKYHIIEMKYA
jgi:hypothetical protein